MNTRRSRKSRKTRKALRDIFNGVIFTVFILSILGIDSESWIPFVTLIGSFAYLMREAKARGICYDLDRKAMSEFTQFRK